VNYYFDKHGSLTRFIPQPRCPKKIVDQLEEIHA